MERDGGGGGGLLSLTLLLELVSADPVSLTSARLVTIGVIAAVRPPLGLTTCFGPSVAAGFLNVRLMVPLRISGNFWVSRQVQ
jgi:hypothetical protein